MCQSVGFAGMILLMVVYTSGCGLPEKYMECTAQACLHCIAGVMQS